MTKINTIIFKEWAEVFRNRWVFFSVIFMPLFFAALPLIILSSTGDMSAAGAGSAEMGTELPEQFARYCRAGLNAGECMQVAIINQFLMLFLIIPLMIPINIGAYSIVGEKANRTLEPLLAAPITTVELLLGKNLAAVLPAVLATWAAYAVFAVGSRLMVANPLAAASLLDPLWLLAVALVGPLLAILSVNFALMVSSRVNDPRVAEQLSAFVILPLILLFIGQMAGFIMLDNRLVLIIAAGLVVLDGVLLYFAVDLFERESILTRWK